jgi:alpha-glucosidase
MKHFLSALILILVPSFVATSQIKTFEMKSPDGKLVIKIEAGQKLTWSLAHDGQSVIEPSSFSLTLEDGTVLYSEKKC